MRNARPFVTDRVVGFYSGTVIPFIELEVMSRESIRRERFPRFRHGVNVPFEFRKHGLTEQRTADRINQMIQQIRFFRLVLRLRDQMMLEQNFVCRRSNFRYKNPVARIVVIVCLIREIGVQGVAKLMRQREDTVKRSGIVQKQVGRIFITAAGICSGTFAFGFGDVDPSLGERAVENGAVEISQRTERRFDLPYRVLPGDFNGGFGNQRTMNVVHVELLETETFCAEFEIVVERFNAVVNRVDERVVNRDRDGILVQRGFQSGFELPEFRFDRMSPDGGVKDRRKRVFELFVGGVHPMERPFSDFAIGGFQQLDVVAVRESDLAALRIPVDGKLQIGIVHDRERLIWSREHFRGESEHTLLTFGERMRPVGFQTFQRQFVEFKLRRFRKFLEFFPVDRHDFRFEPCGSPFDFGGFGENAVDSAAVFGDAGILIRAQMGKRMQFFEQVSEVIFRFERGGESRRVFP